MTLIVDANVALWACGGEGRFESLGAALAAPHLMMSECSSGLREASWRGEISRDNALFNLQQIRASRIRLHSHNELTEEAWRVADELGVAKTYDAEYVALARLLDGCVVTLDRRLWRGARRLGIVAALHEYLDED